MFITGNINWAAGTVIFSGASYQWSLAGSGTKTFVTNGVGIPGNPTSLNTGTYNLGSAFTCTASLTLSGLPTINTNNYALTVGGFFGSGTMNWGSSTVTCTSTTATSSAGTLVINPGTSQFNLTSNSDPSIGGTGSMNFYNVSFLGTRGSINNSNTFNNLSATAPAVAGTATIQFGATQTINGTLSTINTEGNRRVFFTTANYGISQDLVINGSTNLTDADFRGLYVRGTAAPITGTRIGNRGECRGITFSAPKTVYWYTTAAGNQDWTNSCWAATSGGTVSLNNFPLPQDTAVFDNTSMPYGSAVQLDARIAYTPTVDMSARTLPMTFYTSNGTTVYGNWINGSGVTFQNNATLTFSGGNTQTITSAGKTFSCPITIDTYGGTVQLADAFNNGGGSSITVTNGTFNTQGYSLSTGNFFSANSNVRTISFGASTVSIAGGIFNFSTATNLIFNAGTSQINWTAGSGSLTSSIPLTFYNFTYTATNTTTVDINSSNIFNNLTVTAPLFPSISTLVFSDNQIINGTLTVAGASAVRRVFLRSSTIGTPRTLTANAISATDCDFRDITLAGAASNASPTRAGNCGGNSGITFPAAKTVYWNLAGAQNWSATGWATGSGGTPAVNNFPLAQDTAVFDNTGSVTGEIFLDSNWNIGTFDASARTTAMTFNTGTDPNIYGDWKLNSTLTLTSSGNIYGIRFCKAGTQTIASNGVTHNCNIRVSHPLSYVQLADALTIGIPYTLVAEPGSFDAVTYNVTLDSFSTSSTNSKTIIKMGSGTWTVTGTGAVWFVNGSPTIQCGTSTVVLSNNSTTSRQFASNGTYYNKITIGGTTGSSETSFGTGAFFGELASTKTVAHTIRFGSNVTHTIGKWSVTGTAGNLVTILPGITTFTLNIYGPPSTGIDYLSLSGCALNTNNPSEFYVGANSINTANNTNVTFTATPGPRTLYWVGGTGNWSNTTKWSTTSGGTGGSAIPTSFDNVNFNSASNASAYTVTVDVGARCAMMSMAPPASGNVTFAGSSRLSVHGTTIFAATGVTSTYNGILQLSGNSNYTFTPNGINLNIIQILGLNSTWTLGSALTITGSYIEAVYGSFSTSANNYALTVDRLTLATTLRNNSSLKRSVNLNGSTVTLSGGATNTVDAQWSNSNLNFNAGTSQINITTTTSPLIRTEGLTFYNVSFTNAAATDITINGENTFNTLSFAGRTSVGITPVTFNANQTIGTLTLNAGTAAAYRTFLASNTIGTPRTLTVGTLTTGAADIDFRDINFAAGVASITFNTSGSGTWTVPAGVTSVTAKLWGAGGGSGGNGYAEGGGGGGGGAFASKVLTVTPGQSISYTVGVGGAAGGYSGPVPPFGQIVGTTGGATTFSSVTAGGGLGGGDGGGGAGGTASGGDVNTSGQSGFYGGIPFNDNGGLAGNSPNATANSIVSPYNGLQPGGGQRAGGGDFAGKGGDGRITLEWSGLSLPISGTRFGDCGGNSGITFPAAKTVYWNLAGSQNWSATGWAIISGGTPAVNNFPLAQDTTIFDNTGSGGIVTIDQSWNIGTIDSTLRSNSMSISGSVNFTMYGDIKFSNLGFINNVSGSITLSGRNKTIYLNSPPGFPNSFTILALGSTVELQSNISIGNNIFRLSAGTFNQNNYTVSAPGITADNTGYTKTWNMGSGTARATDSYGINFTAPTVTTITGTGTFNLTSTLSKTFAGGSLAFTNITLNQGGAGTLTISGNNTFKDITSTYSATGATAISLSNSTQTITGSWAATGAATRVLSISGTSAASPANLVFKGDRLPASLDYLDISNVKAYNTNKTWYAGTNSTNNGSLGWIFSAAPPVLGSFFTFFS
jgi:hypothetical protein